jgi:hypothetical protein
VQPGPSRPAHGRPQRKYARGEIPPGQSFHVQGPAGRLNLRAQNLTLFLQIAEGVDDETWRFHLRRGDYAAWFEQVIKDEDLACEVRDIAARSDLSPAESRALVRRAVQRRYTAPA